MTARPRAFGYARVSTTEQFQSRLSIDEQQTQIRDFCRPQGLDLGPGECRLGEEAASAYDLPFTERPVGGKIHGALQRGDHIVIAKLDRAFRDMTDALTTVDEWRTRGVEIHILDLPVGGNPLFDKLLLSLLAWMAEFESARKSERMADAWRSAKRSGRPIGAQNAPWGFRWIGTRVRATQRIVYFPEERAVMRLCFDLWSDKQRTISAIASQLIRQRITPYDRRPEWRQKRRGMCADVYHLRYIREMIFQEAQFRFYEARGFSPEEAAHQWLVDARAGTLPSPEVVQAHCDNRPQLVKGAVCPTH
jgi:DNA invertase Pin-like site-specific DNA recombinase